MTQRLNFEIMPSNEELCMGTFKYFDDKLNYKTKNSKEDKSNINNLDKGVDSGFGGFGGFGGSYYEELSNIAIKSNIQLETDHTMYLYLGTKGNKLKITEIVNGIEYPRIVYLDESENKSKKFFVSNIVKHSDSVVQTKSCIYQIDPNSNISLPMLYFEGELNSSYLPHGEGSTYSNGTVKMSGIFEKGQIMKGMLFSEIDSNQYLSYEGSFQNSKPHGEGIFYNDKNIKVYEGTIKDGKRHGEGISYWENGAKNWHGYWRNDMKHGNGILYDDRNIKICNCTHQDDQFIDLLS
jgi:hypothetical protein